MDDFEATLVLLASMHRAAPSATLDAAPINSFRKPGVHGFRLLGRRLNVGLFLAVACPV